MCKICTPKNPGITFKVLLRSGPSSEHSLERECFENIQLLTLVSDAI